MADILSRQLSCSTDVAESSVGDETVILHLVNGTYYGLDPVGTRIWHLLREGMAAPKICQLLADDYGIELAKFEGDARTFLSDLAAQGIVVDD